MTPKHHESDTHAHRANKTDISAEYQQPHQTNNEAEPVSFRLPIPGRFGLPLTGQTERR